MRSLRRGIRIDRIILKLRVAGGDEPCDAAILYGRLQTAWGMLRPLITENLRVGKERVELGLDFNLEKTHWEGELAVTISAGRALAVMLAALTALMKDRKRVTLGKAV
jgi:hypothetical protein